MWFKFQWTPFIRVRLIFGLKGMKCSKIKNTIKESEETNEKVRRQKVRTY